MKRERQDPCERPTAADLQPPRRGGRLEALLRGAARRPGAALLAVAAVSLAAQLGVLAVLPSLLRHSRPADFPRFYAPVAESILSGGGLRLPDGAPATRRPPGYPLAIAGVWAAADATGIDRQVALTAFTTLAGAAGCVALFLLLECVFPARTAAAGAFLWATYPLALWLGCQPNPETVFIPLVYFGLWLLMRSLGRPRISMALAAGVVLGLAALVRPAGILLGAATAATVLVWRTPVWRVRAKLAAMMIAGFVAAILPWEVHLARVTGTVLPLASGASPALFDGVTFAQAPGAGGDTAPVPADVRGLMLRISRACSRAPDTGALVACIAVEASHTPLATAKLAAVKAARSWYGTDEMWHESLILALQCCYLLPALVGLALATQAGHGDRRGIALILAVTLCFWLMTSVFLSIVRYMVPAMGLLFGFAAVAGKRLLRAVAQRLTTR